MWSYIEQTIAVIASLHNSLLALIAHALAWLIFFEVNRLVTRAENVREKARIVTRYAHNSAISHFVMRITGEALKFDSDLNEFELEADERKLGEIDCPYTRHTLIKTNKARGGWAPIPPRNPSVGDASENMENQKTQKEYIKEEKEKKGEVVITPSQSQEKISAPYGEDKFKKPANEEEKALVKDPNYATLMGIVDNEIFGPNKGPEEKKKFKAPEKVAKADAKDPQYETLCGLDNEDLFAKDSNEKKAKNVQKADVKDPQYETLADVKDDIFKK